MRERAVREQIMRALQDLPPDATFEDVTTVTLAPQALQDVEAIRTFVAQVRDDARSTWRRQRGDVMVNPPTRFELGWPPPHHWCFGEPSRRSSLRERRRMAGSTGLEPAASGVTGRRSNQLNYDPKL